jgi:asparagine synthase (glutamine-hydrolysing)
MVCGISGVVYFDGKPVDGKLITEMSDLQLHRGPDEGGSYLGKQAALGHRRLSIIDLASGQQPLSNEDGTIWISFNGEIYNFQDLQRELASYHKFRTRSDTETIIHLYEQYPEDFVSHLRGMFAFALWDESRRTLILARDRIGKKPLYYYLDGDKLVFASEIKAILRHPDLKLDIDHYAISDYLSLGYVPAPKSIYRFIRKVLPGHYVMWKDGRLKDIQYWDLRFAENRERSEEQWVNHLEAELRTAVEIRLMSEVPLGAFLSGGIDSSSIVAIMSQILNQPVKTTTIGFHEDSFDESSSARLVAASFKTDHHQRTVTPDKISTIEKLAWHYDEPFADSSALPTYFLCQAAREKVTVCLSGDGGDENFAGYDRYYQDVQENRVREIFPLPIRKALFGPLARLYPKMDWAPRFLRAKSTFQSLSHDPIEGYFETVSTFRRYEKPFILSGDMKSSLRDYDSVELFREYSSRSGIEDPLSRIQYLDIKTYLTDDILTKVDRASMAHSLEVRCPFLDHKLMELVASIPAGFKLKGRTAKYLLKKTVARILPEEIISRKKMGFAIPLADWFRGGFREYAQTHLEKDDPYLSSKFIRRMLDQHQAGIRDRSTQLWNVLMFRIWLRQFSSRDESRFP